MNAFFLIFFLFPLIVCIICLIITSKITRGRCGQIEYAIIIVIISILQISIAYYPEIYYYNFYLAPFVLLLLFCINIHFSTKRYNDMVIDEDEYVKYLIYISPVSTAIIFLGYLILTFESYGESYDKSRMPYLVVLILANIIPLAALCFRKSDINIKNGDVPVNYRNFFRELYPDNMVNIISINDDYIHINDFEYSIQHYQDGHVITAYRDIDNEHLLTKYFKEKGIHQLGFHYRNAYFELTDEEYSNMIAEIKTMKNVIFIDYPFMVIKNVNIFIRKNGIKCYVVLLKEDKEKLNDELDKLKSISKEMENEKYVCYARLKREDIIGWIKNGI